ncbi:unnamed protein product [Notodromas monacha]|uniref:LysM domain-containing protein n=1 Tax=Notodromas monacha TaxID=399045 RepID=A0A7R9BYY6_9CRUS|nr:unnamed protein product [Notodromas monacha]CAG0923916.1 unnamed protein product [Notodromas monacha]
MADGFQSFRMKVLRKADYGRLGGGSPLIGGSPLAASPVLCHGEPPKVVVKHRVRSGDTLQGLALRYGATMEEIKRANKMWANDHIFCHTYLKVPVGPNYLSSPCRRSHLLTPSTPMSKSGHGHLNMCKSHDEDDVFDAQKLFDSGHKTSRHSTGVGTLLPCPRQQRRQLGSESSPGALLRRVDSSIQLAKSRVENFQSCVLP